MNRKPKTHSSPHFLALRKADALPSLGRLFTGFLQSVLVLSLGFSWPLYADLEDHSSSDVFALEAVKLLEQQWQAKQSATTSVTAPASSRTTRVLAPAAARTGAAALPLASGGQWSSVIPWTPHIPVSFANLPDGRVLTFASNQRTSFPGGPEFTYAAVWNPTTGAFQEINNTRHDMFCGGLAQLPDGRIHIAGGRNTTVLGSIYDWRTNAWSAIQNMNDPRWYNTNLVLPDGQVMAYTGSGGVNTVERWNEASGWLRLTGIPWQQVTSEPGDVPNWHPFLSVAPNGQVMHFGPTDVMHWVNPAGAGSMTNTGTTVPGTHYPKEGAWAVYNEGRVLVAGGGVSPANTYSPTTAAYTVDFRTGTPVVTQTGSMKFPRSFCNAVVLPTGEVIVFGGNTSGIKFSDTGSVLAPEIWNPTTGQWREVTDAAIPRNYHSIATLLQDGRVLSAGGGLGGGDHQDGELYTPPALFTAAGTAAVRPTLSSAPTKIGLGQNFTVNATANLTRFTFIRLSTGTHSVNTDQRFLELPFVQTSAGVYRLTAHANMNVMLPGYWFLFGLDVNGVYSTARIIQVDASNAVSLAAPADQSTFVNQAATLQLIGSGPVGSTLTYSATGLPTGLNVAASTGLISGTPTVAGSFNTTVTVTDGTTQASKAFTWLIYSSDGRGLLKREWWLGIQGSDLNSLTSNAAYPNNPTGTDNLTSFETPTDWADNLGQRLRGYLRPSVTGQYRFWIAGDDESRLILSTTSSAANGSIIARVPTWTGPRAWTTFAEQQSALITLTAGQSYYIEALMKEGGGGDNLAVAWAVPGTTAPVVIPGSALSLLPGTTNSAPVVTNPGSRTGIVGTAFSLQIQASDANNDALSYSATGLPAGLSIASGSGLISGNPTATGTSSVTVSVSDGTAPAVTTSFSITINSLLTLSPLSGAPAAAGTALNLTATASGGLGVQYKWSFGDGTPDTALSSSPSTTKTFANPGRYILTVTAQDSTGRVVSSSYRQGIFAPRTAQLPRHSGPIAYETRSGASGRVWSVNPDNDSVSVLDTANNTRVAEIAVGAKPRGLALAPDGRVWVTNHAGASISIISPSTLAVVQTLALNRGAKPYGIAFSPDGSAAWVVQEALGSVLRMNASTGAILATVSVGAHPRHVSITADSARVLVARFITPRLPGEQTASISTSASVGAEIVDISAASNSITRTLILQHSERADSSTQGRGIPNYLGAAAISPDGITAWVPSKQDNIKRGMLRDGQPLTHDSAVRSIVSRLVLSSSTEDLAARVDFNDAGIANAAAFDPTGLYLFVSHEGGREVAVVDAWNKAEILRITVGRAPQGLIISPDGTRLYVQNFMDRSVTVHDLSDLRNGGQAPIGTLASVRSISTERLTATVLNGKQLFYDSRDNRLALQQYISCAACHNDGGQDGRIWDFTGFGEGLRNTTTLQGTSGTGHGPVHWTGNFDEIQDFEGQIRSFAGGQGLIVGGTPHPTLGTPNAGRSADLDAMAAYLGSLSTTDLSTARTSTGALSAAAAAGKAVFETFNCAQCHSGANFTNSALNVFANVGTIKPTSGQRMNGPLNGFDVPTLRGLWTSAPYLHDGSAATLADAVNAHNTAKPTGTDLTNLVAYLQSIDAGEAVAPTPPATTFTARINFQKDGAPIPNGYTPDYGDLFSTRNGLSYGWTTSHTSQDRDRNVNPDQRLDTLILMLSGAQWNLTVPNGTYDVAISVGDPSGSSRNYLNLEGTQLLTNAFLSANTFRTVTAQVTVSDGRLTLSNAGASNNQTRINSITITTAGSTPSRLNGLTGNYFQGRNFEQLRFSRIDNVLEFNWGTGSPDSRLSADQFSVRWSGCIVPRYSENYTFYTNNDDGIRVWINGQQIINQWNDHAPTIHSGSIALTANVPATVVVEFYENGGGAVAALEWQSINQARQIIPSDRLLQNESGMPNAPLYPSTFEQWQAVTQSSGSTPSANPDGDYATDLMEYAMGESATTGTSTSTGLHILRSDSGLAASYRRPSSVSDVQYSLLFSTNLSTWAPLNIAPITVDNEDGTTSYTFPGIQSKLGTATTGYLRLKVEHAASDAAALSEVVSWTNLSLQVGHQTLGYSYVKPPLYAGLVSSNDATTVQLAEAAPLSNAADQDQSYYLEIRSGAAEGHRFDLASMGEGSLVIDAASRRNTGSALPNLAGVQISIRPHVTLADLIASPDLVGGSTQVYSDRVSLYQDGAYTTYWLKNNTPSDPTAARWYQAGDATLTERSATVIPPGAGMFIQIVNRPINLTLMGTVRSQAFMQVVRPGRTLACHPWPMNGSPSSRAMSTANGHLPGRVSLAADQVQVWAGDLTPGANTYQSFWFSSSRGLWLLSGDASLTPQTNATVLYANRASFIQRAAQTVTVTKLPLPW